MFSADLSANRDLFRCQKEAMDHSGRRQSTYWVASANGRKIVIVERVLDHVEIAAFAGDGVHAP